MGDKKFYKIRGFWQKLVICISALLSILGSFYYFSHWYAEICPNLPFSSPWNHICTICIFVIGVLLLYCIFWVKSVFPFISKFFKWLFSKEKTPIRFSDEEDNDSGEEKFNTETYRSEGLGEIMFYWGGEDNGREAARVNLKKCLVETDTNNIFIAAIGLRTIRVLNEPEVIDNLVKLIKQKSLRIIIAYPRGFNEMKETRPEIPDDQLRKNLEARKTLLQSFKDELQKKGINNIDTFVEFKHYNPDIIPRHFILYDNTYIFVGSYLSSKTGSDSYLMQLKRCSKVPDGNTPGLFNLFSEEINYIKTHSEVTSI